MVVTLLAIKSTGKAEEFSIEQWFMRAISNEHSIAEAIIFIQQPNLNEEKKNTANVSQIEQF